MYSKNVNKIIVNATALRVGGALTILKQFVEAIPCDEFDYLVFVDQSVNLEHSKENLFIIKQNVVTFYRRFNWDTFGLKNWLNNNKIEPIIAISLQNTNFRINVSCPNFIYYHQALPIFPFKWNILKRKERMPWFYKNIYPFFIKLFINYRTEIFVQLNFIKKGFSEKFNFPENKIHVVFPNFEIPIVDVNSKILIDIDKINMFYPATAVFYKNHEVLFQSLSLIDKYVRNKIVLYLTINKNDLIVPLNLSNIEFVFLGQLPHEEVLWMFKNVGVLLFPSFIETLGLPLIEAASLGLPVIASDLPYAREVLENYKGVTYVNYNDPIAWGNAILQIASSKPIRFDHFKKVNIETWSEFFALIKKSI